MALFDFLGSALGGLGKGLGSLGNAFGIDFGGNGVSNQQQQQQFGVGINNTLQNQGGLNNVGLSNGIDFKNNTGFNPLGNGAINNPNQQLGGGNNPNFSQFLFGSPKQGGALFGLGNLAQTVGGLQLANKQFSLGKDQLATEKQIFNNRQERLVEDSKRYATNLVNNSPSFNLFNDEAKQKYIDNQTQSAKFI